MLDGTDIVYVLRVPTHKIMSISLGVGSRLPAYCTSMGRMLLSALPEAELMKCLQASTPTARTKYTVTDVKELAAKVAQARKQGWSLVNQELEEGLVSMAAPITNRAGQTVAALNISGQANRTSAKAMQETMLPQLLAAAQAISRMLSVQRNISPPRTGPTQHEPRNWLRQAAGGRPLRGQRPHEVGERGGYAFLKPMTRTTAPRTTAPRLSHCGILTDSFSFTVSWMGPSLAAVVSLVKLKPPVKKSGQAQNDQDNACDACCVHLKSPRRACGCYGSGLAPELRHCAVVM
jgi:hypothetical protein